MKKNEKEQQRKNKNIGVKIVRPILSADRVMD